jgi:hypothetical protein
VDRCHDRRSAPPRRPERHPPSTRCVVTARPRSSFASAGTTPPERSRSRPQRGADHASAGARVSLPELASPRGPRFNRVLARQQNTGANRRGYR